MDPVTLKVLHRLNYEKLLYTTGIQPRRTRISLDEIFHAAREEPRILEILPALLVFKPTAIFRLKRDLPRFKKLEDVALHLFNEKKRPHQFMGLPTRDCAKAAVTFKKFLETKEARQKSRTLTLRLSDADLQNLGKLASKMGLGYSETLRRLVAKSNQG